MVTTVRGNDDLVELLSAHKNAHPVPGASAAVLIGDRLLTATIGVANVTTGWPVTPDTVFAIGSVTKVYTAALVLRYVEEGRFGLEDRVVDVLPEMRTPVDGRMGEVTIADLLSHTNGIESDYFTDIGRGDEARLDTARAIANLPLLHDPKAFFSYSNSGYLLAGRAVEWASGTTWEDALHQRLAGPCGLSSTRTLPEEVLVTPAATGHIDLAEFGFGTGFAPALRWYGSRAVGSGGVVSTTPKELVELACAHARGGVTANGTRVLSSESIERAQQVVVEVPAWQLTAWGLGIAHLRTAESGPVLGHNGDTPGQACALRIVPDADITIAVCANLQTGGAYTSAVADALVEDFTGRTPPPLPTATAQVPAEELDLLAGDYRRLNYRLVVHAQDGELLLTRYPSRSVVTDWLGAPPMDVEFPPVKASAVDGRSFAGDVELHFLGQDRNGRPEFLHDGMRAAKRA